MAKRGRKKKRGPKKKKKPVVHTYVGLKRPYHIITTSCGTQLEDIYSAVSSKTALTKMRQLQKEWNDKVLFPVKFVSSKKTKTFVEADYQLMLIKKKEGHETTHGKIRDEYGAFVDCVTDNDDWLFLEAMPYKVEETFWVYGYNPKRQRKTIHFIIDNILQVNRNNKYFFKEIVVFKNKLIINSVDKMEMIICKNHIDSVRLYNFIEEYAKDKKLKYILFAGDIYKNMHSYLTWFNKIKELTNWSDRKIKKNTTRD